jgi:DUF4097 and DUF4098 domain-containing protein YvlB
MPHVVLIRPVLRSFVLVTAALGLAACDVVVNSMEGGQAKAEQAWERSYTLSGADTRIEIVNTNGTIRVEASDGAAVEVKATITARGGTEESAKEALGKVEIREDAGASSVRLETRYPKTLGRQGVTVNYTLRVPKSVKVNVATVNGSVNLTGVQASVKAETTNGSIEGSGLGGDIVADTTNGSVKLSVVGLGENGIRAETTNGSIELKLSEAVKATVSARCVNGGISVSDLTFEKTGEGNRRKLDGKLNGGGAPVSLETVNGSIRVSRAL